MEFFEKELGVTWIEHNTGRRVLDIIAEQEQQALQSSNDGDPNCK